MGARRGLPPARTLAGVALVTVLALVLAGMVTVLLTRSPRTASTDAGSDFPVSTGTLGGSGQPDIVFVLTDDLSTNLLPYLPHVRELAARGLSFDRYEVSDSLCCPSRSSILTGRYPHSTGVFTNNNPDGGFGVFHARGEESSTIATDLAARGYRTALMGKYLNQYEPDRLATGEERYVPPGWSEWDVAGQGYPEFDYTLNQNGRLVQHGHAPQDYLTDVLAGRGTSFIADSVKAHRPFFLEIATFTPHAPYTPAPRHADDFPGLTAPRARSYDAAVSSPPSYLAGRRPLTRQEKDRMDGVFRKRAQDLESVDELIGRIEQQVVASGVARDTYLVFSSDNGFHLGEHRLTGGKQTAFETDITVPLVIGGPGIPAGTRSTALAQNVDLRPTFDALAGIRPGQPVDGHDLLPVLRAGGTEPAGWRQAALVEHHGPVVGPADPDFQGAASGDPPTYEALRLPAATFVRYADGSLEYYDLAADPDQLVNRAAALPTARRAALLALLQRMSTCSADTCWSAAATAP